MPVVWRNFHDDKLMSLKGIKLDKNPSKMNALEASNYIHYGERCGRNVIGTDEHNILI